MAKTELEAMSRMITAIENCKDDMRDVADMITRSVDKTRKDNDYSDATKRVEEQVYNTTRNLLLAVLKLDNLKDDMVFDYRKLMEYEKD